MKLNTKYTNINMDDKIEKLIDAISEYMSEVPEEGATMFFSLTIPNQEHISLYYISDLEEFNDMVADLSAYGIDEYIRVSNDPTLGRFFYGVDSEPPLSCN